MFSTHNDNPAGPGLSLGCNLIGLIQQLVETVLSLMSQIRTGCLRCGLTILKRSLLTCRLSCGVFDISVRRNKKRDAGSVVRVCAIARGGISCLLCRASRLKVVGRSKQNS